MKKAISVFFISCLVLSCSKEDEPTPISIDFTPMEIGNYWVFGNFHIDTLGNETELSRIDSVSITEKRNIRGNDYYVFEGSYYFTQPDVKSELWVLRDSLGYLIDTNGTIFFAQNDFSDSLEVFCLVYPRQNDTVYCHAYQMLETVEQIRVPAGSYRALNYQRLITLYKNHTSPNVPNPRTWDTYYANGVGKILETYFYAREVGYYELRLIKYKVN